MARVLGLDPGSRITGYGIIDEAASKLRVVTWGCIRSNTTDSFPDRLRSLYKGIRNIVEEFYPDELAIEHVFLSKNVDSALKLGQARGAVLCGAMATDLAVHEYAAREVKQALVGKGSADKSQVQHMVCCLLRIHNALQEDASDALAVALCHIHHRQTYTRLTMR